MVRRDADEHPGSLIVSPKSAETPEFPPNSRYKIDGEIARGGMGAVLKGRDTNLGRDHAIKVFLGTHSNNQEITQRFIEEAQIDGQLQHHGIAPVYELGQFADQRPFIGRVALGLCRAVCARLAMVAMGWRRTNFV